MEDPHSVNSPRRILSLTQNRRATVLFPDSNNKVSTFGVPADYGPKPSEVYGFVGSISTVVATVIFLVWAYVPENWLHSVGIFYYPSRYWALAVPAYLMVTVVLAITFYIGLNFMATPPPASFNTLFDEFSREPLPSSALTDDDDDERPIDPISDIGIDQINNIMFNNPQ
nr:phosphatidylinositol N-acetylglucosaminyltransferase subunit P-like [Ipomoea batatas]